MPWTELKARRWPAFDKDLDGISEDQIAQHWQLYEGYVKNVNLLNEHAERLAKTGDFGPEFAEI